MTAGLEGLRPEAVLITPVVPTDHGNGLAMRAQLLLTGLSRGFNVTVLVESGGAPPATDARADVIERLRLPHGAERIRAAHPLPSLARAATAQRAIAIAPALQRADLVVVFRSYLVPLLDVILAAPGRPAILLDVDDVESVLHAELGDAQEAERFARLEAHYLPLMDAVVACSVEDARLLSQHHDLREVAVVPNAVSVPTATTRADAPDHDLLFVGNLSYPPNVEGVRWFVREVLPHLSDPRVAIVGSRPVPEVQALASDPRVTLAADVPDIGPWYASAHLAVVPVFHGGGSRIKLIEALAHGLPVVATTRGAAGLPWPPGGPVVVADGAEAFAGGCRELLLHRARARTLGDAGRELVRQSASIGAVAPQIDSLARSMVGR